MQEYYKEENKHLRSKLAMVIKNRDELQQEISNLKMLVEFYENAVNQAQEGIREL